MIDLSDDSKVEIVDTLLTRNDSYFALDELIARNDGGYVESGLAADCVNEAGR